MARVAHVNNVFFNAEKCIMKNVAIIQADMDSVPLPGKVLRDVNGMTVLDRVVRRVQRCQFVDQVVVATSDLPIDLPIVDHCRDFGYQIYAGDQLDVLSRYVQTAKTFQADRIVRIAADCPLIDSGVIDQVVIKLENDSFLDYASNFFPKRCYPHGMDVEAFSLQTLLLVDSLARAKPERQRVTEPIYQTPSLYRIGSVQPRNDHSHLRWVVDTAEDLRLVNLIYRHFGHQRFGWRQIVDAYQSNPHWLSTNQPIIQKKVA